MTAPDDDLRRNVKGPPPVARKTKAPELTTPPVVDSTVVEVEALPVKPLTLLTIPGIYSYVPEEDYHADPCPQPSLSRSVLKPLVDLSPAHAYMLHPKLGGSRDENDSNNEAMDVGTAAHSSFLQGKSTLKLLDFRDWRTDKAKEARKAAYDDGLIPMLAAPYGHAMRLIDALENFRSKTGAFTMGKAEQTVVWQEDNGIWCRARVDWLPDDPTAAPWDLKTTAGVATMGTWGRVCFEKGADLQDCFYTRGLEMIREEPPEPMQFAVIEQRPPFAIAVFVMSPIAREQAEHDVRQGISAWGECLATGQWSPYPIEPQWVFPPSWVTKAREERGLESRRAEQVRNAREHPNAIEYVRSGNFGG